MLQKYRAVDGQSIYDVCMSTYGSINQLLKLIGDSGIQNVNDTPFTGQVYIYDDELIIDDRTKIMSTLNPPHYATILNGTGHYFIVDNGLPGPPPVIYEPQYMIMYEKVQEAEYTATEDDETIIIIPALVNKTIVQITKEIKPLKSTEFTWTKEISKLELNGVSMGAGETLFILYSQIITA